MTVFSLLSFSVQKFYFCIYFAHEIMKKPPLKVGCASKMFETFSAAQSIKQRYKIYLSFLILEGYNFDSNQQATFSFYNQLFSITLSYFSQLSNRDGSQTVRTFPKKSNQLCQKKVNVRSWCHLFLALLTLIEFRQRPFHVIHSIFSQLEIT